MAKYLDNNGLSHLWDKIQDSISQSSGDDGITPTVTVTSITGGHNVAFSYGTNDARNTDFNVMDGNDGTSAPVYTGGTGISIVNGVISLSLANGEEVSY